MPNSQAPISFDAFVSPHHTIRWRPIPIRVLRPFFGYYGGKWRDAAKHYPPPKYQLIVEPFAGSAGYALRYHEHEVVLCERDPVIAAVWEYLISVEPEEILRGIIRMS